MAASTCEGCTLPDEQAEPDDTATPSRSKRDHGGFGLACREPRSAWCWAAARPRRRKSRRRGVDGHEPASSRSRSAAMRGGVRGELPAASPRPRRRSRRSPATFSVPARAPRSWPPPRDQRLDPDTRRASPARRRPSGRRACAPESVRRSAPSALMSHRNPPAAWTASTCRSAAGRMHQCAPLRAIGWITPVSLLASMSETSAARAIAQARRRGRRDRQRHRRRPASLERRAAKRPPASTEGCSIAETSSRSQPPGQSPGVSASTLASVPPDVKTTLRGSAPTSAATCRARPRSAPRAARLRHGPRTDCRRHPAPRPQPPAPPAAAARSRSSRDRRALHRC